MKAKVDFDDGLLADLKARGLIAQETSSELGNYLKKPRTLYCGFDPTADSLHVGSLVPLLTLQRFQRAGHIPIALVGGATGLIGDPSFKSAERQLNSAQIVAAWVERLRTQLSSFISFDAEFKNAGKLVNNLSWMDSMSVLEFLREVGKHFSVCNMINKESVKQRINREGSGISFTEFSYMLLQSYDFAQLYCKHNCTIQIGGSDQWGNIIGGVDLTRRLYGQQVFGLTLPLLTKADGTKFGKTESGTVWLDPKKTSPYAFYQFWMSTVDEDVYRFLKYFTYLDLKRIQEIEQEDEAASGKPQAQSILANEVTRIVHGQLALESAQRITKALFSGEALSLSQEDFEQLQLDGMPSSQLDKQALHEQPLTALLANAGLAKSGKQVKDGLSRGGISINDRLVRLEDNMDAKNIFTKDKALFGQWFLVRFGKKNYHLLRLNLQSSELCH